MIRATCAPDDEEPTEATHDLVTRFLAGDEIAARRLFERHYAFVTGIARQLLLRRPGDRENTPEDWAGEVFCRLLESGLLSRFQGRHRYALRRTLSRILAGILVDAHRRRETLRHRPPPRQSRWRDAEVATGLSTSSVNASPTSNARAAELLATCERILSEREFRAWQWSTLDGLDSAEVGRRLDVTPSRARGIVMQARERIFQHLAKDYRVDGAIEEG